MDLSQLWVRAYVPENRMSLKVGDPVSVTVDSFPGEKFAARITFVSRQAEFTPGNVQTPEERSKQVFRIKVTLEAGRDPREDAPPIILRQDVLSLDDLKEGMVLKGTVRNVVDFGMFVDIGVKQDGLVHISEMADRRVRHPLDVAQVGDIVRVRVLKVDKERGRIGLSMKGMAGDGDH